MKPRTRAGATSAPISLATTVLAIGVAAAAPLAVAAAPAAEGERGLTSPPIPGKVDFGTEANRFGDDRGSHIHAGHDLFAPSGTPLLAVRDGIVVEAGSDGGRGNYIYIHSPAVDETYGYFHMVAPPKLREGDRVVAGELVGGVGCTGSCSGDHLHFELREGDDPYGEAHDPLPLLQRLAR